MLKLKDIRVSYSRVEAVKGISLEVSEGELVALIGANGAGKSTTLKAIAGIEKVNFGEVEFLGKNINGLAYDSTSTIGITLIPEGRQLFPDMTVEENLEMGYSLDKKKERRSMQEMLEEVYGYFPDIYSKRNDLASSLSGGQQQMVAIGRGIMANPKLIMFDEPSLGLSPVLVQKVVEIIKSLHSKGISILLVEQNAHMALKIANRAYVLENGKVVLEDDAKALFNNEEIKKAYLGL